MKDEGQEENPDRAWQALVGRVVLDKYRIERLLGRGGMGAVFQAVHLAIGKRVALKFLDPEAGRDRAATERFQREALAASMVESAHIVQIFDSGVSEDGRPFLVMELLRGEDLRARLNREGRLNVADAVNIGKQILTALTQAHAAGIVHRDLKPDNVFLCERDDSPLFVKLVDFGVSKLARGPTLDTLTRRGTILGTAHYMSPEQAQAFDDIDGRTDLYGVGAILYECLSGRPPHVAPTYEAVLISICTKESDDLRIHAPEVPERLARVVNKALRREREARFESATAFLQALAGSGPISASPGPNASSRTRGAGDREAERRWTGTAVRRRRSWVLGAMACLAGFFLTALWIVGKRSEPVEARAAHPGEVAASASAKTRAAAPLAPSAGPAPNLSPPPSIEPMAPAAAKERPAKTQARPPHAASGGAPKKVPSPTGVASGLQLSTREP